MKKPLILLIVILLFHLGAVSQENIKVIERFSEESQQEDGIKGWEVESFLGYTDYTIVEEDNDFVLKAVADSAASGLFRDIEYELEDYPYLSWRWKVEKLPEAGDVHQKETDDYGARVYVVFPQFLKWNTKTINYIWANNLEKGKSHPNAWLPDNAMMIAVQSGVDSLGIWITEKRNVYEDYRRLFGEYPPEVGAIALMSDADNTGGSAKAYYDDFVISKE